MCHKKYIIFYFLFIVCLLFNCKEVKKENSNNYSKAYDNVEPIEENFIDSTYVSKKQKKDETESLDFDWRKEKLLKLNKEIEDFGSYEINRFEDLNDSLSYSVYIYNDGICSKSFIGTYLNQKEVSFFEIGQECDHDLSVPKYEWKEFSFLSRYSLEIKKFVEKADDSLIGIDGYLKDGIDFMEIETKIDSIKLVYEISEIGEIIYIDK